MDKPWLKQYPEGVPAEIDPNRYPSLVALLEHSLQRFRERPAYENFGTILSYHQLDQYSTDLGAYFQQELKLVRGDRVAIMMPNVLQYPVTLFALLRAGLTVVNVNPLYTSRELRFQLQDSGAKAIIVLENFAHVVETVLDDCAIEHVVTSQIGDLLDFPKSLLLNLAVKYLKRAVPAWQIPNTIKFTTALERGAQCTLDEPALTPQDIAFLQYTGGTTGVAKGAMLSHGNLVANLLQTHAWTDHAIREGEEVIITALPLYHIFSLSVNCLAFMEHGACNVLITNPRDFAGFVKILQRTHFTCFTGVNSLYNALLNTPGIERVDFSRLKLSVGGGMSTQALVADRWKRLTGCPLLEGYGLTETSPCVCISPLDQTDHDGTIGLPIPSTHCSIQNDQGELLPPNSPGELCIQGPQLMLGYWQRPDETAKVIIDGWFHSGDIAVMNDKGYFSIVDRKKDMILVSGFNVYPNQIESVVSEMQGIVECAAVGIDDPDSGEVVKLFAVTSDPELTAQDVISFCKDKLTAYKIPKTVEFCDDLPKSPIGKILRKNLRVRQA